MPSRCYQVSRLFFDYITFHHTSSAYYHQYSLRHHYCDLRQRQQQQRRKKQLYFKSFIPWEKQIPLSSFHRSYGEGHISLAQRKTTTRKPYSQKFCYVLRNVQISDERESNLKTSPRARTLCFVVATPLSYSLLI